MAEPEDHLLEEIEEDLRAERYAKLWKRYGKLVIAGFVALIVGVAGYQGWQTHDKKVRAEQSDKFAAAVKLLADKKPAEAQKAFSALASDGKQGYRLLAGLRKAALLSENGDKNGAQKVYDSIAADSSFDSLYRDLATLLSVLASLDTGDTSALIARLKPLMEDASPWRFSAKEASALLNLRAGQRKKAYEILDELSKDALTPQGIRTRAQELSAAIKP